MTRAGPVRAALALAVGAVAMAMASPAARASPASDTDIRCLVVSGALSGSSDPQVRNLGRASLIYFMGRLEGRGDVANLDARVFATAGQMSAEDVKAQSKICAAMFTAATQSLQQMGETLKQRSGGGTAP